MSNIIVDCEWESTQANVMDDLREMAKRFREQGTPLVSPKEIYLTGDQLIEAYRLGFLRPDDESIRVLIPGPDAAKVKAYLEGK